MNIKQYQTNFAFDEPCEYKGLKIYPIKLKEYLFFGFSVECLLIDKNSLPDPRVISMSYLDFILDGADSENNNLEKLYGLFYLCAKTDMEKISVHKDVKGKNFLRIGKVEINASEFEDIKGIIIEQNLIEVPDYTIQKEIRDKIEEGKRITSKGSKMAGLEDQMVAVSIATGIPLEQVYDMSYRKFTKAIERTDMLIHYKIFLQASMSGMVEFKDKSFIKHWLKEIKPDALDGLVEFDSMKRKMNFEDKKNNGG